MKLPSLDPHRLRLIIFITGLFTYEVSTYVSYLYPPASCDWFYYGFIAKYYAEHGHYPERSWWRYDQPVFIYRTPMIVLDSFFVNPHGGRHSDYRFVIASVFGAVSSLLAYYIEPEIAFVAPWILTFVYNIQYSSFLGSKRTICLLTYPLFGTMMAAALFYGRTSRARLIASYVLGLLTGVCYDGWLEVLPVPLLFVLIPDTPREKRLAMLELWGMFVAGGATAVFIPSVNWSASHGLLTYHRPGLILHLIGNVSEWMPTANVNSAIMTWVYLILLPVCMLLVSHDTERLKERVAVIPYISMIHVIFRFGVAYTLLLGVFLADDAAGPLFAVYGLTLAQYQQWIKFWHRYPNGKVITKVVMEDVEKGEIWPEGKPPFEALLYYEVDKTPPKIVPYDMDWRGYEPPVRKIRLDLVRIVE